MARIDELQKKYPLVHRDEVAKWDVLARGVRDNDALARASAWGEPSGTYQSYDHDLLLRDLKAQGKVRDSLVLRLPVMMFPSGLGASIKRDTQSTYTVRDMGDGKHALFDGDEKVNLDIRLSRFSDEKDEEVTSNGTLVRDLVEQMPGPGTFLYRYRIVPTRFCDYFTNGSQCKFCNFNPTYDDLRSVGLNRARTVNLDEAVEAYKILGTKRRIDRFFLEGGGFLSTETQTKAVCRLFERLGESLPYKPFFELVGEAVTRKDYQRLKDSGCDATAIGMEVWAPGVFEKVCPGKARHLPREGWLEAFEAAVETFGVGRVASHFVAGAELLGPDGFKSLEEARAAHTEGDIWLISRGACSNFTPVRWAPGSEFSKEPENRKKLPPTDFYLDLAVAHHAAMLEYGLYPKQNILMNGYLNPANYNGDLGLLTGILPIR